jgi:hypothetical protein
VKADSGNIEFLIQASAVEGFDILKLMSKSEIPGGNLIVRKGIKHKGIIRVWAMANRKSSNSH